MEVDVTLLQTAAAEVLALALLIVLRRWGPPGAMIPPEQPPDC